MKRLIKAIFGLIETAWARLFCRRICLNRSGLYLTRFDITGSSRAILDESSVSKSMFSLLGGNNRVSLRGTLLSGCRFELIGEGNVVEIAPNAEVRNTWIQIQGSNNRVFIDEDTSIGGLRIVNCGTANSVHIGKRCMIADNVEIWSSDTHSILDESKKLLNKDEPVVIEDHVWLGTNAKVLKGVTIGSGAVVGMSSLITKDIPGNSLCAGVPGKILQSGIDWVKTRPSNYTVE